MRQTDSEEGNHFTGLHIEVLVVLENGMGELFADFGARVISNMLPYRIRDDRKEHMKWVNDQNSGNLA